ncbi:TPA: ClpP-like prohead protease/major capsid protein fusion protein [Proteus mirabilis]|uniref:ClpP-like prohead protease/major capsid protein fusion protein n=1 Tax=Proteus mirabilis TaxID=584 RepID=UPI00158549BF|nr:ClpP-like prohead protease/major capsid protein fusion protein [Proteus mirabilis]MBB6683164.1 Clp protease ClpP [Proteus mirabilis]MDF7193360.1 ATP-dependent Clp protease proteolytic subunit [Proteus mirabilis]MDF7386778.1 ATP-dependent Clp protease proteolytic subunit [Proteus mirabilis]MDM3841411.1 Clp protease ClpP [Proteus mirabilis]QKV32319.1 Clp protease ClpP [Proteus mirabilis]
MLNNKKSMMMPKMSGPVNQKSWFRMQAKEDQTADIYIYDEIGGWGISARRFTEDLISLGNLSHINLHIHSPGGEVFDGIAIYNQLKNHSATITVYIDGLAASMASVIAMVGDTVIMPKNAMMMIHKPWGVSWGDANDMREYADLLDKLENVLIPAYVAKTGKTTEEITAMLEQETWLDGDECVEHGFADKVIEPVKAMASLTSKRIEEFSSMPSAIKNQITPKNTTKPTQQPQPNSSPEPQPSATYADEQIRLNGIKDLFAMFGGRHNELMITCLADANCSVEKAREQLLNTIAQQQNPEPSNKDNAHIYAGNGNIVGDSVRASVMARAGYQDYEKDNAYNSMTLRELARASLTERGVGVATYNPMQMIGMAFTHSTSDFGNILLDVANKAILLGWEENDETFEKWTKKGQLSDFKTAHRVGLGAFPSLRKVREGAEYKYVTLNDKGETIALATYGELFSISRQAIINDDMNMLTDVPKKLGEAAKATIGDLVYAVLIDNEKMSDKKALFSTDHKNMLTGGMDVETISAGRTAMRQQKEGERTLNIRPAFMLVPTTLETQAIQVVKSGSVKGADVNANIINPVRDLAEIIAEPRLDDASEKDWYMVSRQGSDTIEVAYLNGIDLPYIDQLDGFTSDGVTTKVRIDAGVAPVDYRGLLKVTGK